MELTEEHPSGWMPGVFRELRHWVAPDAYRMPHEIGVSHYALCGSPCLSCPGTRHVWSPWPPCADCAVHPSSPCDTTEILWATAILQGTTAHIAESPLTPAGGTALCGTYLIADSPPPGPRPRAEPIRPCTHCIPLHFP